MSRYPSLYKITEECPEISPSICPSLTVYSLPEILSVYVPSERAVSTEKVKASLELLTITSPLVPLSINTTLTLSSGLNVF